MSVVFLDSASLDLGDLDFSSLRAAAREQLQLYPSTLPEQVAERIADAEIVISNKVRLDAALIANAPKLRFINVSATGTNNVDLVAARARGIPVSNCRGYGTAAVAQHVFTLLLNLATRMPDYHAAVRAGKWQHAQQFCLLDYPIRELAGMTLGIVGYGELGQAVAQLAHAFGMQVLIAQRPGTTHSEPGRIALSELLPQVDVLTLHCPLTPETQGLIGAAQLRLMRPSAFLINAARGGIVDEQALADALRHGQLAGAGVDVLSSEPPVQGNPLLAEDIPNLIVTPHCAWGSREARQRMLEQLAENIRAFYAGSLLRVV